MAKGNHFFEQRNSDQNRKRWQRYFIIFIIAALVLYLIFMPKIENARVSEVPYSTFLNEVDEGDVEEVEINSYDITWSQMQEGRQKYYKTGKVEDPGLVDRLQAANVTFKTDIYQPMSPILSFLLFFVLPIILFYVLIRWVTNRWLKQNNIDLNSNEGPMMSFGNSDAKVYVKSETSKTFDDVAGVDEAKESLEEVVDYLQDPKKYQRLGAKAPKGVLLVGPPGTGKTLLAQAVAGEAAVPFFSIAGSEFVEMFVGRGAAKVRDLFKQAKENAPCIVFIDEIDTIGKSRDTSYSSNDEREQTLNQLLTEMDGFEDNQGVIILGATNRPETLDKALLRPGRFDRQVRVELPDLKGREDILKVHARDYKMASNIDYRYIARATAGASGADLANIMNEGALRAVREGHDEVTQFDLEASIDVVVAGQVKKNDILSPRERRVVSYHEIGHALVTAKQTNAAPVEKITIVPRTSGALGYTMQVEQGDKSLYTKQELYNQLMTLAGGRAAEEIVFGEVSTGASDDIEKMTKLARQMVTQYGMSEEFGMVQMETKTNPYLSDSTELQVSGGTAEKIDQEVIQLCRRAHDDAGQVLMENREDLDRLADYLIQEETITGDQFMKILNSKKALTSENEKND